eukprot:g5770.t1
MEQAGLDPAEDPEHEIQIFPYETGNEAAAANDCHNLKPRANAAFTHCFVDGVPYIFLVAVDKIEANTEILVGGDKHGYGNDYFSVRKTLDDATAGVARPSASTTVLGRDFRNQACDKYKTMYVSKDKRIADLLGRLREEFIDQHKKDDKGKISPSKRVRLIKFPSNLSQLQITVKKNIAQFFIGPQDEWYEDKLKGAGLATPGTLTSVKGKRLWYNMLSNAGITDEAHIEQIVDKLA